METENKWRIDMAHSEIAFRIKHLMISNVRGIFKKFDANVFTTGMDFTTADIDVWIDPASINTNDEKRDQHLVSSDFFDVLNFKEITFTADSISKTMSNDSHEMWGELTMKGITKNIKLDVVFGGIIHDPWGNERAGFHVSGKINRKDWKLNWNSALEAGGVMVGDDVHISCEVQLVKSNNKEAEMELQEAKENEI